MQSKLRCMFFSLATACQSYQPVQSRSEVVAEIQGQDSFEWAGLSVVDLGDVNGDGQPDIGVGALAANAGGQLSIFFGPLQGQVTTKSADVLVSGEFGFSNAAQSVTHAGQCDIDGDGLDDVFLGAPFADRFRIERSPAASGDNAGRAHVFFGSKTLPPDLNVASADLTFLGEKAYDGAGFTVGCLGDLDGDGKDELAIAAPRAANGQVKGAGVVYIVYGRERAAFSSPFPLEQSDAFLLGESAYDNAGSTVAVAGDVDSDGLPEFAVGAPGADLGGKDSGTVYFVRGQKSRLAGRIELQGLPHLYGPKAGQRLGLAIAAVGDFNNDGKADVALGGSPVGDALSAAGEAYVVFGGPLEGGRSAETVGLTLTGESGDLAGIGLAALGDVTKDGYADLAVGASLGTAKRGGQVYFVQGRPAKAGERLLLASTFSAYAGAQSDSYTGEVIQRAGDVNADGFVDLLVAARGVKHGQDGAGSVVIVSGKGLASK